MDPADESFIEHFQRGALPDYDTCSLTAAGDPDSEHPSLGLRFSDSKGVLAPLEFTTCGGCLGERIDEALEAVRNAD